MSNSELRSLCWKTRVQNFTSCCLIAPLSHRQPHNGQRALVLSLTDQPLRAAYRLIFRAAWKGVCIVSLHAIRVASQVYPYIYSRFTSWDLSYQLGLSWEGWSYPLHWCCVLLLLSAYNCCISILYYIIIYYSDIHVSLIIMPCQEDTKLMFYCFLYDCSFCCLVLVDSASPSRFWLTRCKLSHIDPLLWKNVLTITVHLFGPRAAVLLMSIDKTIGCKLSGSPSLEGRW